MGGSKENTMSDWRRGERKRARLEMQQIVGSPKDKGSWNELAFYGMEDILLFLYLPDHP